jgi:hypothetical protein
MSYGYLKYLEASIDIDFSKLGNGETTLNEYRYYCDDELLTLSYGFDSYPEEGSTVNSVTFNFYPLNKNNYDIIS